MCCCHHPSHPGANLLPPSAATEHPPPPAALPSCPSPTLGPQAPLAGAIGATQGSWRCQGERNSSRRSDPGDEEQRGGQGLFSAPSVTRGRGPRADPKPGSPHSGHTGVLLSITFCRCCRELLPRELGCRSAGIQPVTPSPAGLPGYCIHPAGLEGWVGPVYLAKVAVG